METPDGQLATPDANRESARIVWGGGAMISTAQAPLPSDPPGPLCPPRRASKQARHRDAERVTHHHDVDFRSQTDMRFPLSSPTPGRRDAKPSSDTTLALRANRCKPFSYRKSSPPVFLPFVFCRALDCSRQAGSEPAHRSPVPPGHHPLYGGQIRPYTGWCPGSAAPSALPAAARPVSPPGGVAFLTERLRPDAVAPHCWRFASPTRCPPAVARPPLAILKNSDSCPRPGCTPAGGGGGGGGGAAAGATRREGRRRPPTRLRGGRA